MVHSTIESKKLKVPPLRSIIKRYLKRAKEIEAYLNKKPEEWGKFQAEFNAEVNDVFRNIMVFEKENLSFGYEDKIYKLRRVFINRIRRIFVRGVYIDWSLRKPFGYAGDFKIIDDIYQNNPTTTGFDRLFDNYYQMSAISVAVRNRKEDFKRLIANFIKSRQGSPLRIMDLASGSCRDIKELFFSNKALCKNVIFDCYDNDDRAIEFARKLIKNGPRANFIKLNAVKLALAKDVNRITDKRYDLIYSTGLFDYFNEKIAVRLTQNLKKLLKFNGIMAISSVRDKYSNPSVHFMEWVGDWNLVYRDEDEFRGIFLKSGFKRDKLKIQYEQQGIMQYIVTINK